MTPPAAHSGGLGQPTLSPVWPTQLITSAARIRPTQLILILGPVGPAELITWVLSWP
jgi:hypothetical protein